MLIPPESFNTEKSQALHLLQQHSSTIVDLSQGKIVPKIFFRMDHEKSDFTSYISQTLIFLLSSPLHDGFEFRLFRLVWTSQNDDEFPIDALYLPNKDVFAEPSKILDIATLDVWVQASLRHEHTRWAIRRILSCDPRRVE